MDTSRYKKISDINAEHHIYLVKETAGGNEFICKELSVYNKDVYLYLKEHKVDGLPLIIELYEKDNILTVIEEKIDGQTIDSLINIGKIFTRDEILDLCLKLCEILKRLHSLPRPVIHRDIKPSNIIITDTGNVVLIDLNAGKFYNSDSLNDCDTSLLGTPGFAAPEQYGFGESTPKTDIYGLGILIKKLLNHSYTGIYTEDIASISKKCAEINPNDRYSDIREVIKDLKRAKKTKSDGMFAKLKKSAIGKWALPGFRRGNPAAMIVATIAYIIMLYVSTHMVVDGNGSHHLLYVYRILFGLLMLFTVFCCFNYMDIWNYFPLCKSKNPLLKIIGIVLLNVTVYAFLLMLLVVIAQFLI